jgi:hypothetical protein
MGESAKRQRMTPWIVAACGLALGSLARGFFTDESGKSQPSPARLTGHHAKRETKGPGQGPTLGKLREISALDAAGCEARLKELSSDPEKQRGITVEAIFLRWISLTSASEVLATMSAPDRGWMNRFRAPFLKAWVTLDPAAAMDSSAHPEFARHRTLHAIEEGRPDFADFLSKSWDHFSPSERDLERALTRLAGERPEIAQNLPESPPELRNWAVAAVARGWAKNDPEAALAWLQSMGPDSQAATSGIAALFDTWAAKDPEKAGKALAEAEWLGNRSFGRSMESLRAPDQPKSAIQLALQLDPFLDVTGLHQILADREFDWDSARAIDDFDHDDPFGVLGWRPADLAQAGRDAASLPPGSARDYLLETVLKLWSSNDPGAPKDPDAAAEFARQHEIDTPTANALRARPTPAMLEAASADPEAAFAVVFNPDREPIAGMTRGQATIVLHHWWSESPMEAVAMIASRWHEGLENDEEVSVGISLILGSRWAQRDPIAASQWVASLPDDAFREFAWKSMANTLGGYAPDLSFSLNARLNQDPRQRASRLEQDLWQVNYGIGKEAAVHLIETSELSDIERETLRQTLNSASRR